MAAKPSSREAEGSGLLTIFRDRPAAHWTPGAVASQIWSTHGSGAGAYPGHYRDDVVTAIGEAFAWLQSQGLLIPAPSPNNTFLMMSRRARRLQNAQDFADYRSAQLLPRALLHERISDNCRVPLDDPAEAAEIVMLASHLLRIVDARALRT